MCDIELVHSSLLKVNTAIEGMLERFEISLFILGMIDFFLL